MRAKRKLRAENRQLRALVVELYEMLGDYPVELWTEAFDRGDEEALLLVAVLAADS